MTIQQNADRIQTTHIGSLPRPHDVLDLLKAKFTGKPYVQKALDATIAKAVTESVRKQVYAEATNNRAHRHSARTGALPHLLRHQ